MDFILSVGLLIIIGVSFLAIGIYLIYSSISGKGVPTPEENSLKQIKVGFKLRGFLGIPAVVIGLFLLWGAIKGL